MTTSEEMARKMAREIAQKYIPPSDEDDLQNQVGIFLSIDIHKALDAQRREVARECAEIAESFSGKPTVNKSLVIAQAIKEKFDV